MESKPLKTVTNVDVKRYVGTWYEIARYPNSFQKGCVATKATYTLMEDGKIDVLNECFDGSMRGKLRTAQGKAKVVDNQTNAKLKVTFFWPFYGDYWIIDLGANYEYAVIGEPKRKYLWILSRTKTMEPELYKTILKKISEMDYDIAKLMITLQE